MKIQDLNFKTWTEKHPPNHADKWFRELFPFHVFSKIDFSQELIGREQRIEFSKIKYHITVTSIVLQDRGTYIATFKIETDTYSKTQAWKNRNWDTNFKIVFSQDNKFISVFAKNEDPSKELISRFMKGNLKRVSESKSLPVSDLLFRTLLLHLAEDNFDDGLHNDTFICSIEGIRELIPHHQFKRKPTSFTPLYSKDRELWICHSFSEEKAHRLAYHIANQSMKLIVVYCNPTYTRHHRCTYENTLVLSLYEFAQRVNPEVRKKYEIQIRFLQNHMNQPQNFNVTEILDEIENPREEFYDIEKSSLMEALGIMKISPESELDYFHSFAALNLINSFLSNSKKEKKEIRNLKLFRDMYFFKTYLSNHLELSIVKKHKCLRIYLSKDLIIAEIKGFQFSFHSVPLNQTLIAYRESNSNSEIVWCGKRLQPISQLVFNYSKALRAKN